MAAAGLHLQVACVHCGRTYRQTRSDQRYCSGACGSRAFNAKRRPTLACAQCGNSFLKFGPRRYCGQECAVSAESAAKRRHGGPTKAWARGREFAPRRVCEVCAEPFYAPPSLVRRGGGRFCSKSCKGVAMASGAPIGGGISIRGIRPDLPGIYFRSSWEANVARWLEWMKACGSVKAWKYEPESFPVVIDGKRRRYVPDFRIDWAGTLVEYLEVKGRMDARSEAKLKAMKNQHPCVRLRLLDAAGYRTMARETGPQFPTWESGNREKARA